jgi:hypothetical protein
MMIVRSILCREGGRLVDRCKNNNSRVCNADNVATRNHMGHGHPGGGGFGLQRRASIEPEDEEENGRSLLTLGLEASEATQNILRLLESSHLMMMGGGRMMMPMAGVWHERGVRWVPREDGAEGGGGRRLGEKRERNYPATRNENDP